ncbi:HTH-type transcriptional activator IlvY [Rubritalea marina]|uniref:HTH-type transcriptional activator IlvY n=1 Tax=Rubritalea marina TaxID=361055 RepID=UPI00047605BD|nr:HTH-type transcriptional activator IlvY [Rubritalea marina]
MNQHEIKHFLALVETMHFGRASELCNLSPSALTRSIKRLEAVLNTTLFIRDTRQVQLTSAGEKFYTYAHKAQKEWEGICSELVDDASVEGRLSIYASVTAVYSLLPDLLEGYRAAFPKVRLNLRTGAAEESLDALFAGDIDMAVAALPDRLSDRVDFLPLQTTQLVFISPRGAGFDDHYETPADIGKLPLVLPRSGVSRGRVDQCLRELGAHTARITEVSGNEGIIAMVRLGCGVGVVPQLVLDRSPFRDEVELLENAPSLEPYVVGLCATRKSLSRSSVAAMWELAKKHSQ